MSNRATGAPVAFGLALAASMLPAGKSSLAVPGSGGLPEPISFSGSTSVTAQAPTAYVRFESEGRTSYGILRGDVVERLDGELFDDPRPTGETIPLNDVRLLAPCVPSKVIAVGLNYRSHIGDRPAPTEPGLFAKLPTAIVGPREPIVIPADAEDVHYEGELVVVIGKRASNVSVAEASEYVFGVTAGNDVSERGWQRDDLQWLRAKASDSFGPIGPAIVAGIDYGDLLVQTRVNGEVRQSESSADLVHGVDEIVSYISRYVTLLPGDVIFTGTPGTTRAMAHGDVVEIEIAGVGVLSNPVVRAGQD